MAAYFTVNTTKLNRPRNYTTSRDVTGREAARYLSKYVTKGFVSSERIPGLHRYEVAEGFQPRGMRLIGRTSGEVLGKAIALMGGTPGAQWWSQNAPAWEGPPAYWFSWDRSPAVLPS